MANPDLKSLPQNMSTPYVASEAVDYSGGDHVFTRGPVRGLIVKTTSGNVAVIYNEDLSEDIIPVVVPAGGFGEIRGHWIKAVKQTGSTAVGIVGKY